MISWIQRYFHKHFRLVFGLILAAMGIPLIVIFSPSSGGGRASSKVLERPFFGVNLGNDMQARRVFADGELSVLLKYNYNPRESGEIQQYSLQRIAGLALADDLHLPAPSADQVAKFVLTLRSFQNEQGQFDQARYTMFASSLAAGGRFSTSDVNRVLRDDTRLDQLTKIVGGPGYVMPHDIKQQLARADSTWTVQVATLDYASFSPGIDTGDEALKKFYEENSFRYDVPARPRFSYVEFKGADHLPPVPPTEAELRAFYNANAANFPVPPDASGTPGSLTPDPAGLTDNFPKVRAQVEAALLRSASANVASKVANDFTVALYKGNFSANSSGLESFLAARRLQPVAVAPFPPENPPQNPAWLASYREQIARLDRDRYFSDALPTMDSYVVLLWHESLPAYKPLLTEVREQVVADLKDSEKRRLFNDHGRTLHAQLQAAAQTPAGFAAAAAKLDVKSFTGFSLRQPPQDFPPAATRLLQSLESGQVSEMAVTADKGYLVFVQEKKLPDLSPAGPRYAELHKQLSQFTATANQNSYLGEMVETELKKSKAIDAR